MKKLMIVICGVILITSVAKASHETNSLILLNAKSQAETEEAIKLIEYFGGEVRHVFIPDVLIGYLPPEVDQKITGRSSIVQVIHEDFNPEDYISDSKTNKLAISGWNHLLTDKDSVQDFV